MHRQRKGSRELSGRADQDQGGRKEEAEILIEKHRNGPTGVVKLYFDSKKTTFLSVDKADFGDFDKA